MLLPTTTEGNVLGAVGVLAAGTALGAAAGYAASPPTPVGNKTVGAIEGGTLGAMVTALGGLLIGEFRPKYKKLGEMTGLVGVGAVVAMALIGATKSAAAAPLPPTLGPLPPAPRTLVPQSAAAAGSRTFVAGVTDTGSVVPMSVGDQLTIALPYASSQANSADWFTFDSSGRPVNAGYQGLTFKNRNTQSVPGGQNVLFTYQATGPLGSNMVQLVFQLLATDANGSAINPQPAGFATAQFTLWVSIA